MSAYNLTPYEMDYVYVPQGTSEYRNVRVSVRMGADRVLIELRTEHDMTASEAEDVLCSLEDDLLRKARIRFTEECHVVLRAGAKTYNVTLAENPTRVLSLELSGIPE